MMTNVKGKTRTRMKRKKQERVVQQGGSTELNECENAKGTKTDDDDDEEEESKDGEDEGKGRKSAPASPLCAHHTSQ